MFTDVTYQDWLSTPEASRPALMLEVIRRYKASAEFKRALDANLYFRGENTEVSRKYMLRPVAVTVQDEQGRSRKKPREEKIAGNRIASGFFFRFVTQQNQFLLSNGVSLPAEAKQALGPDFDRVMESIGEKALLHGVSWGFWNNGRLEAIDAAADALTGYVALLDERTSAPMVGIQFWQLNERRPLYVRLFEAEGVSEYSSKSGKITATSARRAYKIATSTDALGTVVTAEENYGFLPVVPFYASGEKRSELTTAIKSKIDLYDRILSDFGDNLDRANDVYWVLNNFGGTMDEVAELLEQINKVKAVANITDGAGGGSTAEPHTIEVPYAARREALDLLERALYQDYMALDMDALTGGSLTNVAIRAATANLNLKADRYEWQARQFVQRVLALAGHPTEDIRFNRLEIANESELVADINLMRDYIDMETALRLNPYIQDEEVKGILDRRAAENASYLPPLHPDEEGEEDEE